MSTYLVAFIVSEFECRENEAGDFNVCSRPNAYDQTEYSFNVGQKVLAKYDELFDYGYNKQMKKMSMAALPDFPSGAMENWGRQLNSVFRFIRNDFIVLCSLHAFRSIDIP